MFQAGIFLEKMISEEEYKTAESDIGLLVTQQVTQWSIPKFKILCTLDRWEIHATSLDSTEVIWKVAQRVFTLLDHTPVSAFGFNLFQNRQMNISEFGLKFAKLVMTIPIGFGDNSDKFIGGGIKLSCLHKQRIHNWTITQSSIVPNGLHVHLNAHYDIQSILKLTTEGAFSKYELAPLLNDYFDDLKIAVSQLEQTAKILDKG